MPSLTPPRPLPMRKWTRRTLLRHTAATAATALLAACSAGATSTDTPAPTVPASPVSPARTPTTGGTTATTVTTVGPSPAAPATVPLAPTAVTPMAAAPVMPTMAGVTAPAVPATTGASATTVAPVATVPPIVAPAITRSSKQPTGELRLAVASFPNFADALKNSNITRFGAGETLMRLTPQYRLEPWLAERIANIDPNTWRVTLRPNAKFHDGSPVTAADVVAAFARNFTVFPNANDLIRKETTVTAVDMLTVEFKTPEPSGAFPNALTSANFVVHKPATPGGSDGSVLTGPYRVTKLVVDNQMDLVAFPDHWGGPPPIARITLRKVVDPNTEVLALQSNDTDMIFRVPIDVVQGLGPDFTVSATPSGLLDSITFNFAHSPFDDRAVREATAWGLDRSVFVKVALVGQGAVATGIFPPNAGEDVASVQGYDPDRARRLLDGAGWKPGPDGVRVKDGKRLAFALFDGDPSQPELQSIAVLIQNQLKSLGYEVGIRLAQESTTVQKTGDFDALMRSSNSAQTGDPLALLSRAYGTGGLSNTGGYKNTQIDMLLVQLRGELDPAKRQMISRQIQEIGSADYPHVFLAVVPIVSAYRTSKLANFVPHPDDTYLIDRNWTVT